MSYFTFSADDGYSSWLKMADILEHYDYRGTFNVSLRNAVTQRLSTRPRMFPPANVITWDELMYLQNRGHEIACHGTRHINLTDATKEELNMELIYSKRVFQSRGIDVSTYACQFNNYTSEVGKLSEEHYDTVRGVTGVNIMPFKGRIYHALTSADALKEIKEGIWAVGIWHNISPEKFLKDVEKASETGTTVKTVREMTT